MQTSRVANLLLDLQSRVLQMIAYGQPLTDIADIICREAASIQSGVICTILTVDGKGHLHPLASPGLPSYYGMAINGTPIGPTVGSCGRAAYIGEPVEVRDISTDPLWVDFKELALPLGLQACWSSPIKARDGSAVGTFAFYYDTRRGPDDLDREIVARCSQLCAIAIEHQTMLERLHNMAYLDTLSGLPNRASFNLRLTALCGTETSFGLIILDLDHLKTTNDTLGHEAGDGLIRAVSARLQTFEPRAKCFRLGGDEFGVIVEGCSSTADLRAFGEDVVHLMEGPVQLSETSLHSFVTAGGALFDPQTMDAQTLLQNADLALYHGKTTRRGRYVNFKNGMRTEITRRTSVIEEAASAVGARQVLPHYQPIVRLDTGAIVGLEALARFKADNGSIQSAGDFNQAFDDSRIAYAITGQMLEHVARDLRRWLDVGIPFQHVGFNVTTADFQKGDLVDRISEAFAMENVPLKHIILEVNEAVFMGNGNSLVANAVGKLREKGLLVALDDFGTGFASMTHLLDFPVDVIKIDRSFIARLMHDRRSSVIVETLLRMAEDLNMRVVAEGIENELQAAKLLQLGCRLGQGYHYSRPVSADDTQTLLQMFAQRITSEPKSIVAIKPRTAASN